MTINSEALQGAVGAPDIGQLRQWAHDLGFAALGVAALDLTAAAPGLNAWLEAGWHGSMDYMSRHAALRLDPPALMPGALSAVMVSMDYAPEDPDWVEGAWSTLADGERAYVARYALGRDYHKVVRGRLQKLAERLAGAIGPFGYRAFCDSAPVLEVELASRAGLGWRGKHTLLIERSRGSMFFIGTLYTDLPLAASESVSEHCGQCERCISACPTGAIVAPYRLDARRCISYLTIELRGAIPEPLRPLIGNRIYGCDDCQLACPWNKFAAAARVPDFAARQGLDSSTLVSLFAWSREQFEASTAGSAIRRIGHEGWLRNIAVALGNAIDTRGAARAAVVAALVSRCEDPSALVREHVDWALSRLAAANPPD